MRNACPRLLLAAPASGAGKTTLTLGLLQSLLARGMRPAAFKCGPDYIDPLFHREVLGEPGYNLDLFFAPPGIARGLLRRGCAGADVAVIESAMGYYDGAGGTEQASGWHVAAETGTPTLLALRPRGAFLSLAAVIDGFLRFRGNSMIRGIVLNGCGGGTFGKLRPVLERETGLRVYGHLPDMPDVGLDSRHLGLAMPDDAGELRRKVEALAKRMDETVDVDGILDMARLAPPLAEGLPETRPVAERRVRLAVARDAAFCFYYRENLELLESFGAELVPFSPLADSALPEAIGGLYIGGGYPELRAGELERNAAMRESVGSAVASGLPTLAEGGGFLYLQRELVDSGGAARPMAGAFAGSGRKRGERGRFGYVTLAARRDNLLCAAGDEIKAHEFHCWDSDDCGDAFAARKPGGGSWLCARGGDALFAGFPHLYFWSNPAFARNFVAAAGAFASSSRRRP